ncbi:heme exporter protein CcmD [Aestuariibius sp. 2305UL40-4]
MTGLGEYAAEILLAYVVSIALIVALVGMSWARARRAKRLLDEMEGPRE